MKEENILRIANIAGNCKGNLDIIARKLQNGAKIDINDIESVKALLDGIIYCTSNYANK